MQLKKTADPSEGHREFVLGKLTSKATLSSILDLLSITSPKRYERDDEGFVGMANSMFSDRCPMHSWSSDGTHWSDQMMMK